MRVGIIGDSQSEGLGPFLVRAYERRGDEIVGTMFVRGMSLRNLRADPSQVSRALAVASRAQTLVVILGGNNQLERSRYRAELEWFMAEVVRPGQKVLWVGPAYSTNEEWGPRHARTRVYQREFFGRTSVRWIDAWPMTRTGVQHAPDGLHFTRAGYEEWSKRLMEALTAGAWLTWIGAAMFGAALGALFAMRRR